MWINTPNGLVNLDHFDEVKVKKADTWEDYEFVLVAWKQVGGAEDFAWSEPILVGGSEEYCKAVLSYLENKLNALTITNGEPKLQPEPEPDMGYEKHELNF